MGRNPIAGVYFWIYCPNLPGGAPKFDQNLLAVSADFARSISAPFGLPPLGLPPTGLPPPTLTTQSVEKGSTSLRGSTSQIVKGLFAVSILPICAVIIVSSEGPIPISKRCVLILISTLIRAGTKISRILRRSIYYRPDERSESRSVDAWSLKRTAFCRLFEPLGFLEASDSDSAGDCARD